MQLRCFDPNCAVKLELHSPALACPECGGLLEVDVDGLAVDAGALKELWSERRRSRDPRDISGVWRYREFLPAYPANEIVTLGEGNTPLVRGHKSAVWAGVTDLQFKHLGWNPTGCFKDLGMTVGMTEAVHTGAKVVACASTGNTAASLAAYAARAGLIGRVYLPAGQVSLNKLAQALDFGAEVVEIEGSFDDALNTLLDKTGEGIYFLNSINPFRIEGQKTTMFELLDQLDWKVPDYLVVPGGNLGNSAAFGKAFDELLRFGFIDKAAAHDCGAGGRSQSLCAAVARRRGRTVAGGRAGDGCDGYPDRQSALVEEVAARGAEHRRTGAGRDRRRDCRGQGSDRARRHRLRTGLGGDPGGAAEAAHEQSDSRGGERCRHPHRSRFEGYELHHPRS